jgi:hypothetical protein
VPSLFLCFRSDTRISARASACYFISNSKEPVGFQKNCKWKAQNFGFKAMGLENHRSMREMQNIGITYTILELKQKLLYSLPSQETPKPW